MVTHKRIGLLFLGVTLGLAGCLFDSESDKDRSSLSIDGYVRDEIGAAVKGVKMSVYLDGGDALKFAPSYSTFTNAAGYYRASFNASVQSITIIPSKDLCKFTPPQVKYYDPDGPRHNENFLGYCGSMHQIDGHVRESTGAALKNVVITIRDDLNRWDKPVYTNQDGYYVISSIVPGHTYRVTPSFADYRFEPSARVYQDLMQDFEAQDFLAVPLPGR